MVGEVCVVGEVVGGGGGWTWSRRCGPAHLREDALLMPRSHPGALHWPRIESMRTLRPSS